MEAGQVIIVLALFPFLVLLAKWQHAAPVRAGLSITILLCGIGWLIDRVFALGWMPF